MVLTPVNLPEALSNMKEYSMAGFPGCVGSSDCTHIVTDWCEYNLKNKSSWGEEQSDNKDVHSYVQPTPSNIAYIQQTEGLVDGMIRQWLGWILLLQVFVMEESLTMSASSYLPLTRKAVSKKYGSAVCSVLGLDWLCTVPPFGVFNNIDEIRWSKWLESMRKDVECTFGILKLKGR
jgi:hypothetical protein